MFRIFRLPLSGLAVLALLAAGTGCTTTTPPAATPAAVPADFGYLGSISLNVATVDVVFQNQPARGAPYVDAQMPLSPAEGLRRWAADRFKPTGRSGSMHIMVSEASMKETALPRTPGISGYFTRDQAFRYDGRLAIEVVFRQSEPQLTGTASAASSRSLSVAEDVTPRERNQVWGRLVTQMIEDIDARIEDALRTDLAPFARR